MNQNRAEQQQQQMNLGPQLDKHKQNKKEEIIEQGQEPLDCYKGIIDSCGNCLGSIYNILPCLVCCCVTSSPYI